MGLIPTQNQYITRPQGQKRQAETRAKVLIIKKALFVISHLKNETYQNFHL